MKKFLSWLKGLFTRERGDMSDMTADLATSLILSNALASSDQAMLGVADQSLRSIRSRQGYAHSPSVQSYAVDDVPPTPAEVPANTQSNENMSTENTPAEKTVIEKLREDVDFIEAKEKEILARFGEDSKEVAAELVLKLKAFL